MAPKKHSGKKRSRRMKGGMTTGQWGAAVYGDSNSQQAVGAGSNVIRMHDPNSVVAAPQMKGGEGFIDDITASIKKMIPGTAEAAVDNNGNPDNNGVADNNGNPDNNGVADNNAAPAPVPVPVPVVTGGKRTRATKRRKSHKKKGKSSKKRAHKRR